MSDQLPQSNAARYPLFPLHNALVVAAAVKDAGGANQDVQKQIIAHNLKCSDKSGAFLQRISSARSYGLIEGRGAYRLTPGAKNYFFPGSETEKNRAMLGFVSAPPVFNELIKRFDGSTVPPAGNLANILHRELHVAASWKERVAGFFIKASQTAGIIDSGGYLRYRSAHQTMGAKTPLSSISNLQGQPGIIVPPLEQSDLSAQDNAEPLAPNSGSISWSGQNVRIESSGELSMQLWRKLEAYVKVLKPEDET